MRLVEKLKSTHRPLIRLLLFVSVLGTKCATNMKFDYALRYRTGIELCSTKEMLRNPVLGGIQSREYSPSLSTSVGEPEPRSRN
jgi:hypothetical protein